MIRPEFDGACAAELQWSSRSFAVFHGTIFIEGHCLEAFVISATEGSGVRRTNGELCEHSMCNFFCFIAGPAFLAPSGSNEPSKVPAPRVISQIIAPALSRHTGCPYCNGEIPTTRFPKKLRRVISSCRNDSQRGSPRAPESKPFAFIAFFCGCPSASLRLGQFPPLRACYSISQAAYGAFHFSRHVQPLPSFHFHSHSVSFRVRHQD